MGAAALPIALTLAGGAVSEFSNRRTAKKQDREIAQGIIKQGKIQDESKAALDKTLNFAESSQPEPFRADLQGNFLKQLRAAGASVNDDTPGGVSDAFKSRSTAAKGESNALAESVAGLFARIDAPGQQRQAEQFRFGDNAITNSILARNSAQEDFLARLRASGIRPNPFLKVAGSALMGAGGAVSANRSSV